VWYGLCHVVPCACPFGDDFARYVGTQLSPGISFFQGRILAHGRYWLVLPRLSCQPHSSRLDSCVDRALFAPGGAPLTIETVVTQTPAVLPAQFPDKEVPRGE
jgi:hypothetical protein